MAWFGREHKPEYLAGSCGIHSPQSFQIILKNERARADRANSHFALILLVLPPGSGGSHEVKKLILALRQRIRSTDGLGWVDNKTLGILLPGTDRKGAAVFATAFEKRYFAERPPVPFTVYCYPEHWLHDGNGPSLDGENSEGIRRKVEASLSRRLPLWKRALDIAGSLLALVLSSPFFLLLPAYIKIVSPGPVIFKQKRVGSRATPFTFLKFRTMHLNNDTSSHKEHLKKLINSDEPMQKLDSAKDPRIIPGGCVIRKACLDELPQLVNVLRGEMSLVGPRPCLPYEAEEFLRWHSHRFDVLPGLTGLWQVSGKNKLTFKEMIRLDIDYCQRMSPWLDIKILLLTLPTVIGLVFEATLNRLRGPSQELHQTQASEVADSLARQA
jgi:lipopolysaccharide/colanic/teichoic acid biosynthesis glycosyltransferase